MITLTITLSIYINQVDGFVLYSVLSNIWCVVLLCVFTFLVPCCDDRHDFHIKTMFGSSLPPVVCRRAYDLWVEETLVLE